MANIAIGGQLVLSKKTLSVDAKYGPFKNIQEAYDELGPEKMDALTYGLTVAILQDDGNIKEYIITKLPGVSKITVDNFIEKTGGSLTYKGTSDSDATDVVKTLQISNFITDSNRKPKDMIKLALTLSKGNTADNISIDINNIGAVPIFYNGRKFTGIVQPNAVVYLMYNKTDNKWDALSGVENKSIYWS